MNEMVFTVCCTAAFIELLSFVAEDERSFRTVCGLVITLVVASAAMSVVDDIRFEINEVEFTAESSDVSYLYEAQNILSKQISDTLEAAGIYEVKPEVILSVNDEHEVNVEVLKVGVTYRADLERAEIIVDNMFSGMAETEVYVINE